MTGRTIVILAAALAAGAAAGLAALYGMAGPPRNAATAAGVISGPVPASTAAGAPAPASSKGCEEAVATARRIAPLATGEVAAFAPTEDPLRVPDLGFIEKDGSARTLADLDGRLRLVNLWATWCVPCRKEMPALDRLQSELGGDHFQVVAINVDTRDAEKPKTFLKENGITALDFYADPKAQSFKDLRAVGRGFGLPTTLLVDAKGCEIGHMAGPAEWASPDAVALIRAAIDAAPGG